MITMSPAAYVVVMCIAWIVLLALIVAIFHGAKWLDQVIDSEMDQVFSVRAGARGPAETGVQREE